MSTQGVTDFSRLDLAGIDLSAQVFGDIDLSSSDLTGASFENAEIVDVFFDDADLSEANFSGANVEEIDFSLAIGWEDATCDVATRLPRDWRCTDGRPEATDDSGAEPDTD